jgi:HEAT repeat protein
VGLLIDRAGNDTYTADSYSQGRGLYNSFGLLFEGGGDDAYFARQTNECQGLGYDGGPREYGSLGMLIDMAGRDHYACGAAEAGATLRPWYGVVWDGDPALSADRLAVSGLRAVGHVEEGPRRRQQEREEKKRKRNRVGGGAADAEGERAAVPATPAPSGTGGAPAGAQTLDWPSLSLEQVLVMLQHPGNSPAQRAVRHDAGEELMARGPAALEGLMRQAHLENMTIQLRTQQLVETLPGTGTVSVLAGYLEDDHSRTRRLAAYYLGLHERPQAEIQDITGDGATSIVVRVRRLLDDEEAAGAAIRTLGKWRDRESAARIARWLKEGREPRRVAAANALREIGDAAAVPRLIAALGDPAFLVRMTAQRALIALGRPGEDAAGREWSTASPEVKRHLLCVLAAGDSWPARRRVRAAARDPDPGVRRDAVMMVRDVHEKGSSWTGR